MLTPIVQNLEHERSLVTVSCEISHAPAPNPSDIVNAIDLLPMMNSVYSACEAEHNFPY